MVESTESQPYARRISSLNRSTLTGDPGRLARHQFQNSSAECATKSLASNLENENATRDGEKPT